MGTVERGREESIRGDGAIDAGINIWQIERSGYYRKGKLQGSVINGSRSFRYLASIGAF
jgi:hypothetical protein